MHTLRVSQIPEWQGSPGPSEFKWDNGVAQSSSITVLVGVIMNMSCSQGWGQVLGHLSLFSSMGGAYIDVAGGVIPVPSLLLSPILCNSSCIWEDPQLWASSCTGADNDDNNIRAVSRDRIIRPYGYRNTVTVTVPFDPRK